jgi:dienelactone hydrolase
MGVMGMAFGGHLALQGRPDQAGFKAAISMNGFFDMGAFWDDLPAVYRRNMGFALGGRDIAETEMFARRFSLAEATPPACPLLVIHGGRDRIFPIEDIESFRDWSSKAEIVIYDDGNHVCNNIAYRYRALIADWMAEKLGAPPG